MKKNKKVKLSKAIEDSGLKKKYISEQIGIAQGYFAEFISKPNNISIEKAEIICKLLNKNLEDIDWER